MLYTSMGNFAAAESAYRKANMILAKASGEWNSTFAASLNNRASLYHMMGYYDGAELFYRKAMEIRYTALG